MQLETILGGGLAALGLWKLWPTLRNWLPSATDVVDAIVPDPAEPSARDDFVAFEQLLERAERLGSPEAKRCLRGALVPLFGGREPDGPATPEATGGA